MVIPVEIGIKWFQLFLDTGLLRWDRTDKKGLFNILSEL